jgi:trehalose-phosphatase
MSRPSGAPAHLFDAWSHLTKGIRESRRLVILLDFDGTLVEIAPLPGQVRLADETRRVLRRLSAKPRVTLAVISGRRRAELKHHLGIGKIRYLGLYGWETNGNARLPAAARESLAGALARVQADLPAYPGAWIEPKGNTFSVHLLGASAPVQKRVRRLVRERVRPMRGTLRVIENLRDIEVAPQVIGDKGIAAREFLDRGFRQGTMPMYFGDDLSDEPAFKAVRKGITILVGRRRPTQARFFVRGPQEVTLALKKLDALWG